MYARWPESGKVNDIDIKASCYLTEAAHSFRVYLRNYMTQKKPNKKDTRPVEKPDKAIIWVAKTFPQWQSIILTALKKMSDVSTYRISWNIRCSFLIFNIYFSGA